jgi:hypothetical protein
MSDLYILKSQQAAWYGKTMIEAEPGAQNDNTLVLNNSSGSPVSLTGLDAIGLYGGRTHDVLNRGTDPIELLKHIGEAPAAFRFADAAVIPANGSLRIYYNGTRWEVLTASFAVPGDPVGTPNYLPIFNDAGNPTTSLIKDDGAHFEYRGFPIIKATGEGRFIDKNYQPFGGSLNAACLFSAGSNDNVSNNPGAINVPGHAFGAAFDFKFNASGASPYLVGMLTRLDVRGPYTGTPFIVGHWVAVNNRVPQGASVSQVAGIYAAINLEGAASEAVGVDASAFRGNANPCPKLVGVRGIAQNGYLQADEVTGGDFMARTGSMAATVLIARGVRGRIFVSSGHTINEARGLSLDAWSAAGATALKSIGIYADASIDIGAERYFIYSLSTSPSVFSAEIQAPAFIRNAGGSKGSSPIVSVLDANAMGYPILDLRTVEVVPLRQFAMAAGAVDIYTVPAGKKAMIREFQIANPSAAAVSQIHQIKTVGGLYRRIAVSVNVPLMSASRPSTTFVAEAGEAFAFTFGTAGLNGYGEILLFPAAFPLKTKWLADVPLAATPLYTVPAGKRALVAINSQFNYPSGNLQGTPVFVVNSTAAPVNCLLHVVPSGEAVGVPTQVYNLTVAANGQVGVQIPAFLNPGDQIVITAGAAGLTAWMTVLEFNA